VNARLWVAALLVVAACARPVVSVPTAMPARITDETLRRTVDSLARDPAWSSALFSVAITDLQTGTLIAAHRADALVIPASNQKLVTAAVALAELGPTFTFQTALATDAPLRDGVLEGDLIVLGSGDPSFSDRVRGRGVLALEALADSLQQRGIRSVRGDLRAGPSAFADGPLGSGWEWDDLGAGYAASFGDLMFNDRYAHAQVVVGGDSVLRGRVSDRLSFLDAFAAVLAARGMLRPGAVALQRSGNAPSDTLVRFASPPLAALLPHFLKPSQNQHGELWLRSIARQVTGVARADSGAAVMQRRLATWGVAEGAVVIADGSGLSRHNLLTAEALTRVLSAMHDSPDSALFRQSLPVAGRDGTLERRLVGTAAAERFVGKTGSLDRARALSGYLTDAGGRTRIVVLLVNHYRGSAAAAEAMLEHLLVTAARVDHRHEQR